MIHVAIWSVILCMPLIFTGPANMTLPLPDYLRFLIISASVAGVFYLNYFLLIDRYLLRKQFVVFSGYNLLLAIGAMFVVHLLPSLIHDDSYVPFAGGPPPFPDRLPPSGPRKLPVGPFVFGNTLLYALAVGIGIAIRMTRRWYRTEALRKESECIRTQAELQNLKSQVNPHFLFNTLNNIYSFILLDPKQAQQSLEELCRLLRYLLYDCSQTTVPLQAEVNFLHDYVELIRIRLPEHTKLSVSLPGNPSRRPVAPLLFIPLLENAFKHGVNNDSPSFVHIDLQEAGNELTCRILNSYFPGVTVSDPEHSGIGLVNLSKRLEILYPDNYTFEYGPDGTTYGVFLRMDMSVLKVDGTPVRV